MIGLDKLSKKLSIIDAGTIFEGVLTGKGELLIKGVAHGRLSADTLVIAKEGTVSAKVEVRTMCVAGVFDGEVSAAQEVTVLSGGRCAGKVACRNLEIETGGVVTADVTIRRDVQADRSEE